MIPLESAQVYGGTPYTNPPDNPCEIKEEPVFICAYCREEVEEDEEVCHFCGENTSGLL